MLLIVASRPPKHYRLDLRTRLVRRILRVILRAGFLLRLFLAMPRMKDLKVSNGDFMRLSIRPCRQEWRLPPSLPQP